MVITISGEYGCGSKESARLAAKALGYRIYDDEIVTETYKASSSYIDESTLRCYDESENMSAIEDLSDLAQIREGNSGLMKSLSLDSLPLDLRLDAAIHGALNRLAEGDNCILLGRCANYYLRGRDNVITMFFTDTEENKIARIMKNLDCDSATAQRFGRRINKKRADSYNYFTGEEWADADNYDIQINCDVLGVEGSSDLIQALVAIRDRKNRQ